MHRPGFASPVRRRRTGLATAAVAAVLMTAGTLPTVTASARPDRPPGSSPAAATGRCGHHPWCDASLSPDRRASLLVGALTLDERIGLLGGDDDAGALGRPHTHTGLAAGVARLDVPAFTQTDGPMGVRQGPATALPASIAVAASFDSAVARQQGETVGIEARTKGDDLVYGPTVNILRTPLWGRAFESYGEDPYLTSRMGVAWIRGLQGTGVMADVKHFAVNNQEGSLAGDQIDGERVRVDARVGERALREIYLPAFETAVTEGKAASVMCSYNKVNGTHSCENATLLRRILRDEWGFKGFVLADYGASKHIDTALRAGLDYEPFPFVDGDHGENLTPAAVRKALADKRIRKADIDAAVHRLLRGLFATGFFDRTSFVDDDTFLDRDRSANAAMVAAAEGTVLLKDERHVLPLDGKRVHSIALIGSDADRYVNGGGSSSITPYRSVTVRAGIEARAGHGIDVRYDDGSDPGRAEATARQADVAIVVAAAASGEGFDRTCLALDCPSPPAKVGHRDRLIERVAAANPNTVVVLETGAPVLTPWRDRVAAIVEAWYPGQEGGRAIAGVLFGDTDPGGRLPATFPAAAADLPTAGDPAVYPGVDDVVHYHEGVFVGYRWYDRKAIEPAFPFGFGLSYTTFRFDHLRTTARRGRVDVTVQVHNTGHRTGTAVPQLYVEIPSRRGQQQPPRQLRAFAHVAIPAGHSQPVHLVLRRRAFSTWDATRHRWVVEPGCYGLAVGTSSRHVVARQTVAVGGARCAKAARSIDTDLAPVLAAGRTETTAPRSGPSTTSLALIALVGIGAATIAATLWVRAARRRRPRDL